jgi:hypothetical protein
VLYVGEAALGGNHPAPTVSGATITSFYDDHRAGALRSGYIEALAMLILVWFAAEVGAWLGRAGQTRLDRLALSGAVLAAATYLSWLLVQSTLAYAVADDSGPDVTQALYRLIFITQSFVMFPTALLVGAASVAAFTTAGPPRWYGWAGCLIALGLLVAGADVAPSGTFAPSCGLSWLTLYVLFPAWVVTTGVLLSRLPGSGSAIPAIGSISDADQAASAG